MSSWILSPRKNASLDKHKNNTGSVWQNHTVQSLSFHDFNLLFSFRDAAGNIVQH